MRVIATDRLILRWFTADDASFILTLVNDPSWIANIGDRGVRTLDDARAFISDRLAPSYWTKGHGLWAIERRSDGVLVGMCGLIDRDSLPAIDVGYALAPPFWGQGYAREATAATLGYARDVLAKTRILAIVQPENARSIRVLESLGMARVGSHRPDGEARDLALFSVGAEADGGAAEAAIEALVARFYAAFANRHTPSQIASVPALFLPAAVVTVVDGAGRAETMSVRAFVTPRATLLCDGRLTDFEEHEVAAQTQVTGALAHRASRYEKAGSLDGVPFQGGGDKHFQLVQTARGWKIAALAWQDAVA
jgi:RimJ/RimL family protein N-acetyltransferase